MSGLAGFLRFDGGEADADDLGPALEAIAHRGPEGRETWSEGPAALAHLSLEAPGPRQPLCAEGLAVSLDGRIDNLPFLMRLLGRESRRRGLSRPGGGSAPEALLEAYRLVGPDFLKYVVGDFALALWDAARGRLLLARDPIGMRPLYLYRDERRLVFGSEAKALLAFPGVPCAPDFGRTAAFDRLKHPLGRDTFFRGVQRLLPGRCVQADASGRVLESVFFRFDPQRRVRMAGREAYRRRFRKLFIDAVRCRLPREGAAGFTLSGGLDSSSVASAAALVRDRERPGLELKAFSYYFKGLADERRWAEQVCREKGLSLELIDAGGVPLLEGLEAMVRHHESPLLDSTDLYYHEACRKAAARGAKVVLGGDWGDQVLTSLAFLGDLLRAGRFAALWREFRELPKSEGGSPRELVKMTLWYLLFPNGFWDKLLGLRYLARRCLGLRHDGLDHPVFREAHQRELYDNIALSLEFREGMERIAARHGIESRLPFLDRRLVAFLLAVPVEERVREGLGKRVLREGLRGITPDAVLDRKDKGDWTQAVDDRLIQLGFGSAPQEAWFRRTKRSWEATWFERDGTSKAAKSPTGGPASRTTATCGS